MSPSFSKSFRPHEKEKPTFSKCSSLKSVFEKPSVFDGLVWTVGLTVEIKLRFRDGLEWTVGLTLEIKLRFLISSSEVSKLPEVQYVI